MNDSIYSIITGTGSYIPSRKITNESFLKNEFYDTDGSRLDKSNQEIIDKFEEITTISARHYITDHKVTSDMAFLAAVEEIRTDNIEKGDIDYVIVAHNFGDVKYGSKQSDIIPSLATRVKHKLQIKNPKCVAYDILFGFPGWIEGVLKANAFIKSGMAKRFFVIC